MKRSEAVLNIVNVLRLTGNHYCDNGRDEQDAERILKRLEAIAMLPPPSNFNIHTVDKQLGFVAEVTYDFPINEDNSVNLWEPEDEEK